MIGVMSLRIRSIGAIGDMLPSLAKSNVHVSRHGFYSRGLICNAHLSSACTVPVATKSSRPEVLALGLEANISITPQRLQQGP